MAVEFGNYHANTRAVLYTEENELDILDYLNNQVYEYPDEATLEDGVITLPAEQGVFARGTMMREGGEFHSLVEWNYSYSIANTSE